ncbi:unnamed protein product [Schistosoma curassoni]|uniref:Uncharacterized protein n=1 Tax=Schistosoma curassoni TaxID=6186 RepID=A0A183KB94_9TREM|nr:unnamed protein product [Schistosoma curassoni]
MSRTSARQQRMREQTLNEECIVHEELGPRTSSECRSKGSKLIISSPTTTSHPCLNLLLSGSQASTQQIDDNVKLTSQYNRGFGAGALLASLNAANQQHQTEAYPKSSNQDKVDAHVTEDSINWRRSPRIPCQLDLK